MAVAMLFFSATASAGVDGVIVRSDGRVERCAIGDAVSDPDTIDHAWIWSEDAPPLRVDGCALGGDVRQLLRRAALRTEIRLLRQDAKPLRSPVRVIAAPQEMWSEVPEDLLPVWTYTLPRSASAWRLRATAANLSSEWIDVASTERRVTATLVPATRVSLRAIDGAVLRLFEPQRGIADPRFIAQFRAADDGVILLDAAPPVPCTAVIDAADRIPSVHAPILASELPASVTLDRGAVVAGRITDRRGKPVANAMVQAEWWAARDLGSLVTRATRTDAVGAFVLRGVALKEIALTIARAGFAHLKLRRSVANDRLDLGAIALAPEATVQLIVTDGREPVAEATAMLPPSRQELRGDAKGRIAVPGVDAAAPLRAIVRAPGFLRQIVEIPPPLRAEARVNMRRSFRVRGRFVDEQSQPVIGASLRVARGNAQADAEIAGDGHFDLDLDPDTPLSLVLASPASRELRVPLGKGQSGEVRDLGDLRAPAGVIVRGRVVDGRDLQPIAGARVWTVRGTLPLLAWARGDMVQAQTDSDGRFELRGLESSMALLRIDAPNFARAFYATNDGQADAGDIALSRGATLHVKSEAEEAIARVDLRGDGFDADVLRASLRDGEVAIAHVPPGDAVVTVEEKQEVVCEQRVSIGVDDSDVDVRCASDGVHVRGRVLVDGRASSGMLRWERDSGAQDAVILTTSSPAGVPQQRVVGGSTKSVVLFVADGRFESNELRAGSWRVTWLPDSGGSAGARDVALTAAPDQSITLEYGGASIRGLVVDRDDAPVAHAFVSIAGTLSGTASASDGSFELAGLAPGQYRLRARDRNRTSDVVTARVEAGREAPNVRLRVDQSAAVDTSITILHRDGSPAMGATVVVETDGNTALTLTTDAEGIAHAAVPADARMRVAAIHNAAFAFGNWSARADRTLRFGDCGELAIVSERPTAPSITSNGWDVAAIIARLAARPIAAKDRPLLLRGLPAGPYIVADDRGRELVTVRAGDTTTVTLK